MSEPKKPVKAKKTTKKPKKKSAPKKMGRPTKFTKELSAEICAQLALGVSLRSICKDPTMPSLTSIYTWMPMYPDFLEQYKQAKQDGCDAMAEEMLEIAHDGTNDYMEKLGRDGEPTGEYILNGEHVQRSRLRIDTMKFYLSKIKPKRYGDKIDLTSSDSSMKPVTRIELVAPSQ